MWAFWAVCSVCGSDFCEGWDEEDISLSLSQPLSQPHILALLAFLPVWTLWCTDCGIIIEGSPPEQRGNLNADKL